jgi:iron complex outermembrane recepter protein
MKISKLRLLATTAPLAAMLVITPAYAQDESADGAEDAGIEEIIVTAQRREENLQTVPISISAFSGDQLKDQGTTDISGLENRVPGFTFGRSGSDARPAIRGVRTENVGVNGDTTIGLFIDGVYMSRASQGTLSFVDIERVEVQRGPQGTLYGRNTFGGNIAISTAKPSFDEYKGGVDATIGENGRYRVEGFVNAPLSDTVAIRLAGALEESNGYVKNDNPLGNNLYDDRTRYVRMSLALKPSDAFSADFKFDYSRQGGAGGSAFGYKLIGSYFYTPTNAQLYNATPVILNTRGGNRDGLVDAPLTIDNGVPIYQAGNPYRIDTDQRTLLDLENYGLSANLAYDFGGVTLRSITGYTDFGAIRTSDSDFSGNQIAIDYQNTEAKTFSQELQLLSDASGPFTYVVGAYYFKDKLRGTFINQQLPRIIRNVTPNLILAQNGAGFYDQQRAETESLAAYAQVSYQLTEQLKLTGGIRYTEDEKDFAFANANAVLPTAGTPPVPQGTLITLRTAGIPDSAFGVQGAPTNCTYTSFPPARAGFQCLAANTTVLTGATYDTAKFKRATWRVGVDYQIADENLLYASVSTGFRSGGFNSGQGPAALQPTFAPEKVTAFEIGSKNRFAGNTIQLNLSAFYNKYNGLQEQRQVPQGATTLSIIENSGKARSYGVELEALWQPIDEFTFGGTFSYLNAKYTEYDQVPAPFGTSILIPDATQLTPTVVNGVTIAPAGQRRLFAPGYDCTLLSGTGGAGQPAAAFGCDISGNRIPYAPEYTASIFASYDIDLGSAGRLTPYAAMSFSGAWFGQPFNSILERQKAYAKLDLALTWAASEQLELRLFVNNVTDKATATRFVWGGGGALQASYAPPRLWGVRAGFKF